MRKKTSKMFAPFKHAVFGNQKARLLAFVLVFSVLGVAFLIYTRAASPTVSVEAESGALSSYAEKVSYPSASEGMAVRFGNVPASQEKTLHVSTNGADTANGSEQAPWRTLKKAFQSLSPGDTLVVGGGTYSEQVKSISVKAGTSQAPVTVKAKTGERPIIQGELWLTSAHYWTIDGISVTWGTSNSSSDHMVKVIDSDMWRLTNAEIWGSRGYSALLISGGSGWRVDHNYIHDTAATNGTNQDHLIYVSRGMGGGIIEYNSLSTSPNGRGVKVGPPDASATPVGNLDIRYNTFYDNRGPSNIQLSYGASNNRINRNIFVKSGSGYANVTAYMLSGTGNVARENIGWESTKVVQSGVSGLTDGGGNIMLDPKLVNPLSGDFHANNPAASGYGRW